MKNAVMFDRLFFVFSVRPCGKRLHAQISPTYIFEHVKTSRIIYGKDWYCVAKFESAPIKANDKKADIALIRLFL